MPNFKPNGWLNFNRDGWYIVQPTDISWRTVQFVESAKAPTLEQLQGAVGGWIEHVQLPAIRPEVDAFCHEEGKLIGLPLNPLASMLYGASDDAIVGPFVVVCGKARRGL